MATSASRARTSRSWYPRSRSVRTTAATARLRTTTTTWEIRSIQRRLSALRTFLHQQPVPNSAHRLYHDRPARELVPQVIDVHVDGAALAVEVEAPHHLQQLLARHDDARVARQGGQKIELLCPQLKAPRVHCRLTPFQVYEQGAEGRGPGASLTRRVAAQYGLDAGRQLARIERLRHVVVRAQLESHDLVHVVAVRGEHDD